MAVSSIYQPSLADISTTASGVNAINVAGQNAALNARLGGAAPALEAQSSQDIMSELKGQIPQDVLAVLGQQGAEGAVGSGQGGGGQAAYLEHVLGGSLAQVQAGMANLSAADARNPAAPIFDPTTQLLTPAQTAAIEQNQQRINLATQQQMWAQANALRGGGSSGGSGVGGGGGAVRGGGGGGGLPTTSGTGTTPNYVDPGAYNMYGLIGPTNPAAPITAADMWTGGAGGSSFVDGQNPYVSPGGTYDPYAGGTGTSTDVPVNYADPGTYGYEDAG